ncbi:---NA--- [Paramuricea clavata]|uniref:---NA n=1 Tax=Paramuricea clavata TaxID=317549 RepID=A0A7D9JC83_PARCT|nr:---NA--- [Paramuricea clavata]
MNGDTNDHNCTNSSYKCNECEFVSDSQGGLGVHRVKKHKANGCDNINSVSVVCEYPQGKSFYCCICNTIIKSWPNFKRHYKNIHPNIPLTASAVCTLCNRVFSELKGAGVHMKREHDISSSSVIPPSSPSPIMSSVNFADSQPCNDSCAPESTVSATSPPPVRRTSKRRRRSHKLLPTNQPPNFPSITSPNGIPSTNLPSCRSTPLSQIPSTNDPVLEPMVALIGCTAVESIPLILNSPPSSEPLDSMVSLIGCTDEDRIPNAPDSPPDMEVVINPLVAFIGSTDEISTSHNPDSIPTVCAHAHKVPDPVICDLSPDDDDDDDPFDIPPPLSPPRPLSQFSFLNPPPSTSPSSLSQSLNPNALNFQPTQNVTLSPPPGVIPTSPINCSTIPNVTDPGQTNASSDEPTAVSTEFVEKWSSSFAANTSWQEFSEHCNQFANDVISECDRNFQSKKRAVPRRPARPSARPVNNNRRPLRYNPIEARRIQSLYRISKKRAARQVICDNKPSYSGSVDEANQFFTRVFGEKNVDVDAVKKGLDEFVPSGQKMTLWAIQLHRIKYPRNYVPCRTLRPVLIGLNTVT